MLQPELITACAGLLTQVLQCGQHWEPSPASALLHGTPPVLTAPISPQGRMLLCSSASASSPWGSELYPKSTENQEIINNRCQAGILFEIQLVILQ